MPKLTIELDVNTHRILKELAKKDRRSLTNYINITLEDHANNNEKTLFSAKNTEINEEKSVNTTNLQSQSQPQKQKPRLGVVIGEEFDENANISDWSDWGMKNE